MGASYTSHLSWSTPTETRRALIERCRRTERLRRRLPSGSAHPLAVPVQVVPKALLLTPNQFEAELLTGRKIDSEAEAVR